VEAFWLFYGLLTIGAIVIYFRKGPGTTLWTWIGLSVVCLGLGIAYPEYAGPIFKGLIKGMFGALR
jgi:hypothetical protein